MLTTRHDRPQRYTARLEVHLDQVTQTTITRFVTAFRRRRSAVLRQVLEWGLTHGQGWTIDRHQPAGRAQRVFLRLEPELRERVEEVATTAGGDISVWLRHVVDLVTLADFPASWQAASAEQKSAPKRSHDLRQYGTRFMLRLDDASLGRLDEFTQFFQTCRAEVIRQLIMQATPKVFPKSWRLAAKERRQQQAHQAQPDGIRCLYGKGQDNAEKYVLFDPGSPLWAGGRWQRWMELAERARDDPVVHQNFVEFIGMLEYGTTHDMYPPRHEAILELAKRTEIVGRVWKAATARRLQPRALGSLKEDRENLARIAGSEEHLVLPVWWNELLSGGLPEANVEK
jgi:hypothetical protein